MQALFFIRSAFLFAAVRRDPSVEGGEN